MPNNLPSYLPYFFETEYFPEPGAHQLSYADRSLSCRDLRPSVAEGSFFLLVALELWTNVPVQLAVMWVLGVRTEVFIPVYELLYQLIPFHILYEAFLIWSLSQGLGASYVLGYMGIPLGGKHTEH